VAERRNNLILVGLIGAALVAALLLIVPGSPFHKKPVLGLDLQGGLEVVLKAVPPEGRPLQKSDLNRSLDIIRERIDKLGVAEPNVTTQGNDQISVELPGVKNADRAREIIGQTAKLELFDLQAAATGPSIDAQGFQVIPSASLYDLLASAQTKSLAAKGEGGPWYLFDTKTKELLAGPLRTEEDLLNTEAAKQAGVTADNVPKGYAVLKVPENTTVITCGGRASVVCPGVNQENPQETFYYLFKHTPDAPELADRFPQMTGADLKLSGTRADFDTQTGQPIVLMQFTNDGADKFHEITRAEAQRGQRFYNLVGGGTGGTEGFNQNFAIVLDNEIRSFPSIDFRQYPDGISGSNGAQITGIGNVNESKDLALVLQTGALPVEFVVLSDTLISATLGEDSLREALKAAIAGLLLVAIFLLVFYRFLGLVAVIGLGVYALLLYAIILVFNVTLTLPGFAGMILTIGVAADANIVIFERIKEEARSGKSVRAAIGAGYAKGFATIVDANVVTAITALVLFAVATAGVRGFALLLLLGTGISMITAVFATRAMLGLLAGFRWFDSPKFMGAEGVKIPKWIQHDYIGKRRIWFGISAAVLAISIGSIAVKGLNLGIDFEGGTEVSFTTPQPTSIEEVRAQTAKIGQGNAVIQGTGQAVDGKYEQFQVRTEALDPADQSQLRRDLQSSLEAEDFGVTTVSASFGRQIAQGAIWAIFVSLLLVVIYITLRFQWKFAVATIVAMLHDVLIAIGIYSLTGFEVTTATVAAILTVLGYSIYDTIIILDRVRENIPLMRRATFPTIANISLWETIRRSLATTFITLLPISALYFFGGATLKDFAFALLVGIGSGAYSSIFIAAPLVSWLKEREPEFARRQDTEIAKEGGVAMLDIPSEAEPTTGDEAEPELEAEPEPVGVAPAERPKSASDAKRERRRQRRKTRPHGRAR
jgi:SecD/SecF fusion protein